MQERTAGRQFAALGFRRLSVRPPEIRPAGPGGVWKLCRQGTGRPARCGARQENRGVAPAQSACRPAGRRAIPDANGPASLAPAVCPERAETAAPVMPYANTAAMTSPKSRRPSLKAPTPSWRRTGRAGTAQGRCAFPITSPLLPLPPHAPQINPVENVRDCLRANKTAISVFNSYHDIVDRYCKAWNVFANNPATARS